jgi:hypothetical protein
LVFSYQAVPKGQAKLALVLPVIPPTWQRCLEWPWPPCGRRASAPAQGRRRSWPRCCLAACRGSRPTGAPPAPGKAVPADAAGRAIAAYAAWLALPGLEAAAAALAEAEGIVCHLTSLVLVDEAGEAHQGIPTQRKVPLMTPGTARLAHMMPPT